MINTELFANSHIEVAFLPAVFVEESFDGIGCTRLVEGVEGPDLCFPELLWSVDALLLSRCFVAESCRIRGWSAS